jgi:hypothetical protein
VFPRRDFLGGLVASAAAGEKAEVKQGPRSRQWYELRTIQLRTGQAKAVGAYLTEVALPSWRRHGVGPVGVFEVVIGPQMPALVVLLPLGSPAALTTLPAQLAADTVGRQGPAAAAYRDAPAGQPAFMRVDSALLWAFENVPQLEPPPAGGDRTARVFELRTYESPTETAHLKKMEMFTRMGEIEIFRRVGLAPVFFAQTVIGPRLPSFSYMLTFPDMAAREKAWAAFRADPEWQKLRATPGYTDVDTVSNISDVLLRPAAYSQI